MVHITLNTQLILPGTLIFLYVLLHWGTLIRGGTLIQSIKKGGTLIMQWNFFRQVHLFGRYSYSDVESMNENVSLIDDSNSKIVLPNSSKSEE